MFRCDNCGSGYSAQAASSWTSCPRCLAREKIQVPLTFELGWKHTEAGKREAAAAGAGPRAGRRTSVLS
jgi:hypothetical protein